MVLPQALQFPGLQHRHTPTAAPGAHGSFLLKRHRCQPRQNKGQQLRYTIDQRHSTGRTGIATASGSWRADFSLDPPVTREQLDDPAYIHGSAHASVLVQDRRGDIGLDAYMRLPVEHYFELDPGLIKPLGGSAFALQVPRVSLLNVWVEPLVHLTVRLLEGSTAADSAVIIEAVNWSLRGSELIESLGLNRRFSLAFRARLTWTPAAPAAAVASNGDGSGAQLGQGTAPTPPGTGQVHGELDLNVWSEVIGPFLFTPRSFLEGSGNAVLGALVRSVLPPFMAKLSADYEKWTTTPEYRIRRAQQGDGTAVRSVQ